MYIIDKHTDFYDHYSHIYGLDKAIVFDRRSSIQLTDEQIVAVAFDRYDREKTGHALLEIGDVQYLIRIEDLVYVETPGLAVQSYNVRLLHTYEEHRHIFDPVMSVRRVRVYLWWGGHYFRRKPKKGENERIDIPSLDELIRTPCNDYSIDLPILANTKLTSILDPQAIWSVLQNYISSLDNDRDVSIPMTDVAKAATHGFDKHSFRHPVK